MKIFDDSFKQKTKNFSLNHPFITSVLASIFAAFICGVFQSFVTIPKAIMNTTNNEEYLERMRLALSNSNTNNNSAENTNDNSNNFNITLNFSDVTQLDEYSEGLTQSLENAISVEENDISFSKTAYSSDEIIATDVDGKEYLAEDLIGKKISLSYYDEIDDKIVYFLGSYNENYHWDGICLTNAFFLNGDFYGACESEFDDGIRKNYKSILATDENEWSYANKICTDNGNDGINISYSGNTNIRIEEYNSDIIVLASVDNIYERLKPNMMIRSYYKGLTSDEKYNDDTGLAYLINFDSDGYVQFLYCGPFSKGLLNTTKEHTGWEVLYSIDTEDYYTKEGEFINNHAVDPSANDISIEEIQTYLKDNEIDPEINLEWK